MKLSNGTEVIVKLYQEENVKDYGEEALTKAYYLPLLITGRIEIPASIPAAEFYRKKDMIIKTVKRVG